jgi:hypothetical protein
MNKFLNIFIFLSLVLSTTALVAKDKTKKYKGAFFEVSYPHNFTVKPSIRNSGGMDAYDSAFFISPDKKVKFYIFSPQWSGDATDIAMDSEKEIEKDVKTEKNKNEENRWFTYASKVGSKTRSYHEIVSADKSTVKIFGIEYDDKKSYDKYKAEYLKFKKSLQQFAD